MFCVSRSVHSRGSTSLRSEATARQAVQQPGPAFQTVNHSNFKEHLPSHEARARQAGLLGQGRLLTGKFIRPGISFVKYNAF